LNLESNVLQNDEAKVFLASKPEPQVELITDRGFRFSRFSFFEKN
jgi:hypothetical protein